MATRRNVGSATASVEGVGTNRDDTRRATAKRVGTATQSKRPRLETSKPRSPSRGKASNGGSPPKEVAKKR